MLYQQSMYVPSDVLHICRTLQNAGFEAWLVGGAVRDSILGRTSHDWDVATSARPESILSLFPRVIETGIQHGTVTVLLGGEGYEVTTYRGDGTYEDGRRPSSVQFLNSIEEDLARRDFTVNAIAFNPLRDVYADPYGGKLDLKNKLLRAVRDPFLRFSEDGLRVLRACRFAATLGFEIEEQTLSAIPASLETYSKVSVERVQAEWLKAMLAPEPSRAFRLMASTGILGVHVPEFIASYGCTQNKYHAFDVWEHTMRVLDAAPVHPLLRLGALFHDIGKPRSKAPHPVTGDATFYEHETIGAELTDAILSRLKFSTEDRNLVVHLVRHHFIRYEHHWGDSTVRRWVRRVGVGNVANLCALARADIAGKGPAMTELEPKLVDELEHRVASMQEAMQLPVSTRSLAINGKDVMNYLGLHPGPEVGKVLDALLEAVLDDPTLNTRDKLLELALNTRLGE